MTTQTQGISPKVYVPVLVQVIVAVLMFVAGMDVEGRSLLGSAGLTFAAGWKAQPGTVVEVDDAP